MAETQTFNKLVFEISGKEYEFDGGGGGSQPGPNTVGTDQIIDGSVREEDLSPEIEAGDGDIDSIFDDEENNGAGGGMEED